VGPTRRESGAGPNRTAPAPPGYNQSPRRHLRTGQSRGSYADRSTALAYAPVAIAARRDGDLLLWLPPLLAWVHDYSDDVQGMQALIQLLLSFMTLLLLDTTTLALFEQGGGALLILGEPGAGKTVELLTLAQGLLTRPPPAADPSDPPPVPVPLNLSTWASQRLPLANWIADELFRRHQIPRAIGADWLARGRLLPLLDGLDEVAEPHRADCAAATFHRTDGLTPLVVCCRVAEYRALPPLALNTAIHLLPLDRGQLERYLRGAGPALAGLRQAMAAAPFMAKLAATPLMLNVMSLTWQERPAAAILAGLGPSLGAPAGTQTGASPAPADEARDALFAAYLARVFGRKPDQPGPWSPAYTRRTLAWLAARMQHHGRTLFQIEALQGDWGGLSRSRRAADPVAARRRRLGLHPPPVAGTPRRHRATAMTTAG
jgi:hypothetical protein